MTSHRRIRARNAGLDRVRRITVRVAGGGIVLSGGIAALASATYGGSTHHRVVTLRQPGTSAPTNAAPPSGSVAPLTDPTLPPTTLAPAPTNGATPTTSAPVTSPPTTAAPVQQPQYTPQTQPTYQYTPPVVVSGGS